MIRSLLVESDTIAPGMPCAILRLIPDGIRPASGQAFVDPPTAAAFSIERIDELDAGECYAETGHLSRAVRLAVRNVSDAPELRLYALLWDLDRDANPGRRPIASLTAAYPGRDATIPVPGESALRDIEKEVAASIDEADTELAAAVPRAAPSAENCVNCDVRHLCDVYWSAVAPRICPLLRIRRGLTIRA